MANVTAQEQLMLELVNRARMNPAAEAARFGIDLNKDLPTGTLTTAPKQVLAMNDKLVAAARGHSQWMIDADIFSHTGKNGTDPFQRMEAAGYDLQTGGENIAMVGSSQTLNATTAIIAEHKNLFLSSGHRKNILNDDFREIGIGQKLGVFQTSASASLVTQNFGTSGTKVFVTGVVYNDTTTNDNFYTVGEGKGGVIAKSLTNNLSDTSNTAGGYELALTAGAKSFQIGAVKLSFTLGQTNVKLDLVNSTEVWTNASVTLTSGATAAYLLGIEKKNITGSAAAETLYGNSAVNVIKGGSGNDKIYGAAGNDVLTGDAGNDYIRAGAGKDTISGGANNDRFVFASKLEASAQPNATYRDVIKDFVRGQDKLDLSTIDAKSGTTANDAFVFKTAEAAVFTGVKGQLIWDKQGSGATAKTIVMGDIDGNKVADFHIELTGHHNLTAADFML